MVACSDIQRVAEVRDRIETEDRSVKINVEDMQIPINSTYWCLVPGKIRRIIKTKFGSLTNKETKVQEEQVGWQFGK